MMRNIGRVFKFAGKIILKIHKIFYLIFVKKKLSPDGKLTSFKTYWRAGSRSLSLRARLGKPLFVRPDIMLGLSLTCNIRCVFCLAHSPMLTDGETESSAGNTQLGNIASGSGSYLDFGIFKNLIDDLEYLEPRGIDLSGNGETLTYPLIGEAIDYIRSRPNLENTPIDINTNGELLNNVVAQKILKGRITRVNFSLNAPTERIYAAMHFVNEKRFHDVIRNIRNFVKAADTYSGKPLISASFVLTKMNYRELVEMLKVCDSLGINRIRFILMYFCIGKKELLKEVILEDKDKEGLKDIIITALFEANKRRLYTNLQSVLNILNFGSRNYFLPGIKNVYTIQTHASGAVNPYDFPYKMGDIYERSIVDIWYSPEYTEFRNMVKEKILKGGCMPNRPFCFRCGDIKDKTEKCRIVF